MKTGIFYATTTGTTAEVASSIAKKLGVAPEDVFEVAKAGLEKMADYDLIIAGSPTWGSGEVQDDWYDVLDALPVLDLKGRKVAVFGCGDEGMSDTFCDAVGSLYEAFGKTGATMIGAYNTFPYEFDRSKAVPVEGAYAVGLLIDEVNHPDQTDRRISEWTDLLKKEE